jgi:hypothetical protein
VTGSGAGGVGAVQGDGLRGKGAAVGPMCLQFGAGDSGEHWGALLCHDGEVQLRQLSDIDADAPGLVRAQLASRKERQGQHHLSGFILYDHRQSRIVVRALFSQLPDFVFGMRKCRRNIRQVRTMRVIFNPPRSAYGEETSRHPNVP